MKREISQLEYIRRELVCYFFGHNYKHVDQVKTDKYAQDVYHKCGNPYWRSAASWDRKCRRCRRVEIGWGHYPWYQVIFWAFKYAIKDFWFWITIELEDNKLAVTKYPFYTVTSAIFHSISQWFLQLDDRFNLPSFVWGIPVDIAFKCQDKIWSQYDKESSSVSRGGGV